MVASGWVKCNKGFDFDSMTQLDFGKASCYFYADPKTGVIATGWKSLKAPSVDGMGNIIEDSTTDSLRVSNVTKKLYFNETASAGMPKGALIRNTDMTIKGKVYCGSPFIAI